MRLVSASVDLFWNIVASEWVAIEDSVTCLVGKNESGKTAFLHALYRLNPVEPTDASFDADTEYPRWRKVRDANKQDLSTRIPVNSRFALDDADRARVSEVADVDLPQSACVVASRAYDGTLNIRLEVTEQDLAAALARECQLDEADEDLVTRATTIDGFIEEAKKRLTDIQRDQGKSERATALRRIDRNKGKYVELIEPGLSHDVEKVIRDRLPRFYYFDDFSTLPGRLDPERLLTVPEEQLGRDERTAVSLMRMAGVVGKEFTDETFERRIAELEAAAAEIKQQVFTYWTQNRDLRIRLVSESELEKNRGGSPELKRMVDIRVEDVRHEMTTNLRRRSKGFQWFLSFIAGFSQFQGSDPPVVVLLDEPALGLHAQAQGDFLRFISERLGADNQVLYSTHSPFMVDPRQLAQVRVVEDQTTREDPDRGAKVFEDQLSVDSDTVFPLQAALGYDLAQHLFVGAATHVVVEGTSDYTFLQEVSEYLKSENRTGLSSNISVVPVGGIDKIPTFVALLGAHVDVAVLVDSRIHGSQKLATYAGRGLLSTERLVTVAEITGGQDGDIEDLFEPREYLALFNAAFGTNVQVKDMVGDDPIVRRLERHYGAYNHGRPASCLLRGDGLSVERLDEATLGRFESLLEKLNATVR